MKVISRGPPETSPDPLIPTRELKWSGHAAGINTPAGEKRTASWISLIWVIGQLPVCQKNCYRDILTCRIRVNTTRGVLLGILCSCTLNISSFTGFIFVLLMDSEHCFCSVNMSSLSPPLHTSVFLYLGPTICSCSLIPSHLPLLPIHVSRWSLCITICGWKCVSQHKPLKCCWARHFTPKQEAELRLNDTCHWFYKCINNVNVVGCCIQTIK